MKNFFIIINLFLLTFVAFFLVKIVYKSIEVALISDSLHYKEKTLSIKNNHRQTFLVKNNYKKIIKRNIFKVITDRKDKALKNKDDDLREIAKLKVTTLKLKLLGTVAGGNPGETYAVIEDQRKKKQSLYQVGQRVQGAKIIKILRQQVVLEYNGEDQVLEMSFLSNSILKEHFDSPSSILKEHFDSPGSSKAKKPNKKPSAPKVINLTRSSIDNLINNSNQALKQARIKPHLNNGQPNGLLVFGIKPESLYAKMELKNGDIIQSVNGKKLKSVDDTLKLFQGLKNASDMNIKIKRHGRTEEINYHVR